MIQLEVESVPDAPCPRADVTVTGLAPGSQVVTLWRTVDGSREPVHGARTISVNDSFFASDFHAPLGRPVRYELEVVSGADAGVRGAASEVEIPSEVGYIQDPLNPASAVPVRQGPASKGYALLSGTFAEMAYKANSTKYSVMGANMPVAISGPRQVASGVTLSMLAKAEDENVRLRSLVMESSLLVIRGLPSWGSRVPATATYAADSVTERNPLPGDTVTRWELVGDRVRSTSERVLVGLWTYQDVAEIWAGTYDQKQAAAGPGTYLRDQKDPTNTTT